MIKVFTNSRGFSLAEVLVVITIVAIIGVIITDIFINSLRGSNKATVIDNLKRNGQVALETMDKNIRNAKKIICPLITNGVTSSNFILIQAQDGITFTRYTFIAPTPVSNPTSNGYIQVDFLNPNIDQINDPAYCVSLIGTTGSNAAALTDTNTTTGVSIETNNFITRDNQEGYGDIVTINFDVNKAILAPFAFAGQVDKENFKTTIELRSI
jgi:prepilin-type N-terminal cleavage/methylation domain-containing protein